MIFLKVLNDERFDSCSLWDIISDIIFRPPFYQMLFKAVNSRLQIKMQDKNQSMNKAGKTSNISLMGFWGMPEHLGRWADVSIWTGQEDSCQFHPKRFSCPYQRPSGAPIILTVLLNHSDIRQESGKREINNFQLSCETSLVDLEKI